MMKKIFLLSTLFLLAICGFGQRSITSTDTLYDHFLAPPDGSRPRVWWHWMNGNITTDGIRKDLEWMKRSGIGGFQNFDAALSTPQVVEHRLTYMTPEWQSAFQFTTKLADSLHLEMAIAGSPGWSESGGPWVERKDGMKKLVWTETFVKGGTTGVMVPEPPHTTGPFQNIPLQPEIGDGSPTDSAGFYRDVAIIAYKLPAGDKTMNELKPVITSSGGNFTLDQLNDGDLAKTSLLPRDTVHGYAWIQYAFPYPETIKSVTIVGGGDKGPFGLYGEQKDTRSLQVSDDGVNFRRISYIPAGDVLQQTINIPATTAKYFRVTFNNLPAPPDFGSMFGTGGEPPKPPAGIFIAELALHTATRIEMFEEKDAFAPSPNLFQEPTPTTNDTIAPGDVIDVTGYLGADGHLNWTVPPGNWVIARFGYSLLGITNHPASSEATGLEVDKLDPVAVKNYFVNYLNQYKKATGGLMGANGGLQYMVTDSWEAGAQNWTENLPEEFRRRRGYTMLPWMPVLTGRVVGNAEKSERFLFDFRKTISELVAEYHYDALTDILKQFGMRRYSESHESGRALIADGMEVKRKAAIPMSAMWTPNPFVNGNDQTGYEADIRESASVAHIYGQNIVAAESLTALGIGGTAWAYSPETLKPTADLELASGLNRFVIHTSVHQPVDDKIPGLGLGPFGQWFNRHETWAEEAKPWTDYLSRSSYLLQQGKFAADILYYYGEDNNITALFGKKLPDIPEGYSYDFINSDALINLVSVKDGKLVTPSGMTYRLLVLDKNAEKMSLAVLRKINILVKSGAIIAGAEPKSSPSLSDNEGEFTALRNDTWYAGNTHIFIDVPLDTVLKKMGVTPDFSYSASQPGNKLMFVHRLLPDGDIYWVNNRSDKTDTIEALFRTFGKAPELWHPESGSAEPVSYRLMSVGTKVKMVLLPHDAVFVVFRKKAVKPEVEIPASTENILDTLGGSWRVHFQKDRGAPDETHLDKLATFTENQDNGIKYFSGTASYTKTLKVNKKWLSGKSALWLDLGEVNNIAELYVNGRHVAVLWRKPFRTRVTDFLNPGENTLEIRVTNLWVNRLIGDAQPGVVNKITYTTMPFYKADSPLLPSGLLGPVRLIATTQK